MADGYAILRKNYDERGNVIEQAYFGADGKPVSNIEGYAKMSYEYDDSGKASHIRFFDADDRELHVELVITEIFPNTTASRIGLSSGDRIISYNGRNVNRADQFGALVKDTAGSAIRSLTIRRGSEILTFEVPAGLLGVRLDIAPVKAEFNAESQR